MAVTGDPVSGVDGKVEVNGLEIFLDSFTVTPQATDVNTFNYGSGGNDEGITGKQWCDFEFSGFFDRDSNPFGDGVDFTPGVKTTELKLYVSRTSDLFFLFPQWRLLSAPVTSDANSDKPVKISLKAKSDGPWFYPL